MPIHATSTEVYSGKNLFNSYSLTNPVSGTIVISEDGTVSLSGNANSNGYCRFLGLPLKNIAPNLTAGTTYYLSLTGENLMRTNIYLNGSSSAWANGASHTITQGELDDDIVIYGGYQVTTDFKIMITAVPDDNYEPYVGTTPSPLIKGVAHVSTSKNLLNMQSDSNGEYFGTMAQHGYAGKNLYIGSPSFAGYVNESSWTSDGTYNGMPVVKKAAAWSGVTKLVNIIAGKTYTFSAWVKSDQSRRVDIYATGGGHSTTAAISPGYKAITTSTNWERVSFTFVCTTSGSIALRLENTTSSDTNYTYISGYQLEIGQETTSYEKYIGDDIYSGKNLLNYTVRSGKSGTGDVELGVGVIKIIQTTTDSSGGNCFVYFDTNRPDLAGQQVTFSTKATSGGGSTGTRIRFTKISTSTEIASTLYPTSSGSTRTFTVPSDGEIRMYFYANASNVTGAVGAYSEYTEVQLEVGSATAFEPYVGGIPSPNPDYPQEIVTGKLASKNLLDVPSSYTVTTYQGVSVDLKANKTYTIQFDSLTTDGSGTVYFWGNYDGSGYYIDDRITSGNKSLTVTPNHDVNTLNIYADTNYASSVGKTTTYTNLMVSESPSVTTYEPYFTPIELAQIGNYQDSVYKSGGSWYTHKELGKIVLDGTENWNGDWQNSGTPNYWQAYIKAVDFTSNYQVSGVDNTRCDHFVPSGTNSVWNFQGYGFALNPSATYTLQFKMPDTFMDNVADFKTWLGSNNTTAYYTLGTATDTAITDSATILWLNKYDTDSLPHHKYINTRRTTYVGASGLASAIDLYNGSYASALPTYTTANDHHLTTANGGTYTVSLQNISASIISGTVTFSVFTNQRKIDFSWNGSATSTNVSVSLQADEYIKSIYAYIPQNADAGITLSQQLESGSLTDFEPYYNIVKIYAGNDLVFEDTSLTD